MTCSEETTLPELKPTFVQQISDLDSLRIGNEEIPQHIINALIADSIEHWENEDGSIGFYKKDTDRVDAIGFFAIGTYAARQ